MQPKHGAINLGENYAATRLDVAFEVFCLLQIIEFRFRRVTFAQLREARKIAHELTTNREYL